jgi:hypothetical protein
MLMLKQVWTEIRLRKLKAGLVAFLVVDLVVSVMMHSWIQSWLCVWMTLDFVKPRLEDKEMPEVLCFLPMERKARLRYVKMKGYVEASFISIFLLVCLLLTQIPLEGHVVNWWTVAYTFVFVLAFFVSYAERIIMDENAGSRKMERKTFREWCCPAWYKVVCNIFSVIWVIVMLLAFYLCDLGEPGRESFGMFWKVGLVVFPILLIAGHVMQMRYVFYVIDIGDYNVGGRGESQEVCE